jgi:hypothetical protein
MQLIVDPSADQKQRDALLKIMRAEETDQMATMWWVYTAMCSSKLEPIFEAIDFQVDVDARRGKLNIPGLVESVGEPIKNPVTGQDHRVRIDMPNGFEYRLAEIGSGRTTTWGKVKLQFTNTYAQFARLWLSNKGVVG